MNGEQLYKIGEVAEILNLKTHVLRFWETEFPQLDPLRTESGQRLYTNGHIALLRKIQQLLHEQGMTIEGAKRMLAGEIGLDECGPGKSIAEANAELLNTVREELETIRQILSRAS